MGKLKTYNEFVNEGIMDVIKAPVKYVKIKNNLKKFQKAKVQQALNDVDFAKRKEQGAGEMTPKQKEVLVQANKAKNAALADTAATIQQRMKDIATTPILTKVVSLGTTKAKMAANKIVLKAASGEEAKKLKIKATELSKEAAEKTGELKDYESTAAKKKEAGSDDGSSSDLDDVKTTDTKKDDTPTDDTPTDGGKKDDTSTDGGKKNDTEGAPEPTTKTDDTEGAPEPTTKTDDTEATPQKGQTEQTPEQKAKNSKEGKIKRYKDLLAKTDDEEKKATIQSKIDALQKESWESFLDDKYMAIVESELLEFEKAFESESYEYVSESVSQKFSRLRNEM